jgi:hypothetical protein
MPLRYGVLVGGLFFAGYQLRVDSFVGVMLAISSIFLFLFITSLTRYQRRVGVGKAGEQRVADLLSDLGVPAIHDVYLPTHDGSMQIDHVALFPNSLAVIETKTFNGRVDMDNKRPWFRVGRLGQRYVIHNPLWQLEAARKALVAAVPNVRVWGLVVLAGNHISAGLPPHDVKSIGELRDYIVGYRQRHGERQQTEQINQAWLRLNALKETYAPLGKTHVMNARKRRGERFYDFEEIWPLWLWGSLAAQCAILGVLARYSVI